MFSNLMTDLTTSIPGHVTGRTVSGQKVRQIGQELDVGDADRILHERLVPPSAEVLGIAGRHPPEVFAVGGDGECAVDVNGQPENGFKLFLTAALNESEKTEE